jgi:hypothetical protein
MKKDRPSENRFSLFTNNVYRRFIIFVQFFQGIKARITKKRNDTKVFCIGFPKTGTTSLHKALGILGYRALDWPRAHLDPKKGWIYYFKESKFDAFSDSPLFKPGFFKELDENFPNSKFILTVRNPESLVKSWDNYFSKTPWDIENEEDKNRIITRYNDHKKDVIEYFKDKPSQLLIFDIFSGDSWEKLCKFIDKPIPDEKFPHKRKAKYKKK